MAQRDPFRANGGIGQDGPRTKRPDWPGFAPALQPGVGLLPAQPGIDQQDARELVTVPPGIPFDHRNFDHHAMATMLGVQAAMSHPHIRALVQTMFDNMLRATFKPMVAPPWIAKPFVAADIGFITSAYTAPANGAASFAVVGAGNALGSCQVTMPQGRMGVITEFAQSALQPTDWDNLTWRLVLNGTPVFPWNSISCQMSSFQAPRKVQIILPPGSTFALEVSNSSLVTPVDGVGGLILGWSWPVEVAGNVMDAHGQASVA